MAHVKHATKKNVSVSVGGVEYKTDANGVVEVPPEHVKALEPHGFYGYDPSTDDSQDSNMSEQGNRRKPKGE